jgi:hypothetical protein
MHPHQLHATIAAHNLTQARHHLAEAVTWEIRQRRQDAHALAVAAPIQAWRPVVGRGRGGHGDPVSLAVDAGATAPARPVLDRLAQRVDDTVHWLARSLSLAGAPLAAITAAVPELTPAAAREVWLWLGEADQRVRRALLLPAAEELMPGRECPACRLRLVHAQVAVPGRPVVCRAEGCRCRGEGCGCGMSVLVEGLAHVWEHDTRARPASICDRLTRPI